MKLINAIMIGDRIDNDIIPAKLLGMYTIWIKQGFGQYWNITEDVERADYVVHSLMDICNSHNPDIGIRMKDILLPVMR